MSRATAMVLAAGYALRLRPLTSGRAKAVVPFLNRPILDYTLDWLSRSGHRRVVINLHHAAESIRFHYGRSVFGVDLEYSVEQRLLGTAGGPRAAINLLEERFLLVNGDVAFGMALGALRRHHEESGACSTLGLHRGPEAASYPQIKTAADGQILCFPPRPGDAEEGKSKERPHVEDSNTIEQVARGCFAGLHLIERSVFDVVPRGVPCDIIRPVYRELLAEGLRIDAIPLVGAWYEVGDPSRYIDGQLCCLARGDLPLAVDGYVRHQRSGYATHQTRLDNAALEPPYLLGPGVRVKGGSWLSGVVAARGSHVETGSELSNSVLWENARIGAGSSLHRVIVLEGVHVPSGTEAEGIVFTADGPVAIGGDVGVQSGWAGTPAS